MITFKEYILCEDYTQADLGKNIVYNGSLNRYKGWPGRIDQILDNGMIKIRFNNGETCTCKSINAPEAKTVDQSQIATIGNRGFGRFDIGKNVIYNGSLIDFKGKIAQIHSIAPDGRINIVFPGKKPIAVRAGSISLADNQSASNVVQNTSTSTLEQKWSESDINQWATYIGSMTERKNQYARILGIHHNGVVKIQFKDGYIVDCRPNSLKRIPMVRV